MGKITPRLHPVSPRLWLTYFLRHVCQLIKQAKEKAVSEKCIRTTEILNGVIIIKKIDEKFDACEKQLRSKCTKLMN